MLYSASFETTSSPNLRRESSDVSSENSCFFSSSKDNFGGEVGSLYSNNSVCFSCSTLLLVSIFGFGCITSAGFVFSLILVLIMTFSCLSSFSALSFCFSLIFSKNSEALSPKDDPEETKSSCNLLISATHETSKERVSPSNSVEENKSRLPMKLNGIMKREEIFEPIKPPPS